MNNKKYSFFTLLFLPLCILNAQTFNEKICDFISTEVDSIIQSGGDFSFSEDYTNSGSSWEIDWSEELIFNSLLKYEDTDQPNQSYELRFGKGGQVYSFKGTGFGEAIPPQWRPSFDSTGSNTTDPGLSDPIKSHHGNWAPWNDEVWQFVGSDQRDLLSGKVKTRNIHQGGSYMNNFSHRNSDLTTGPFSSPIVQEYMDVSNESVTTVSWGQSENPSYVYDPYADCTTCFSDPFKALVLYYQRYKNIGNGVIQVDFMITNFNTNRGIDYWNVPFIGIRNSSLPYVFMSNNHDNNSSYELLNTKVGHPVAGDESSYLPEFKTGALTRVSGNSAAGSGWFAVSNTLSGNGPTIGFVTAKSTENPRNGYGDIRYGTAMSNATRDVTIFTRRAIGGAADPVTGLKPWGIIGNESIKGRYFIVVEESVDAVVNQIETRSLVENSFIEKVTIDEVEANKVHYQFTTSSEEVIAFETTSEDAAISLNTKAFTGGHPVFLIQTESESVLSSDPYFYSDKPYDGALKKIELLGFQSTYLNELEVTPIITSVNELDSQFSVYPNPSSSIIHFAKNLKYINNVSGQTVFINSNNSSKLDISNWANGIYYARFSDSKVVKILKL